jgi:hypothetical protein
VISDTWTESWAKQGIDITSLVRVSEMSEMKEEKQEGNRQCVLSNGSRVRPTYPDTRTTPAISIGCIPTRRLWLSDNADGPIK